MLQFCARTKVTCCSEWDVYPIHSVPWLLLSWKCEEPGISNHGTLPYPFALQYSNLSNRSFILTFYFLLSMCIQVQFSVYTFCTETDIRVFSWLQMMNIGYLISMLSTLNHERHLMTYTASNYHEYKSEILLKRKAKIYPQCAVFVYDLPDYKLWDTAKWQKNALDKASDLSDPYWIVVWNTPSWSPRKINFMMYRSETEFRHKIFSLWPGIGSCCVIPDTNNFYLEKGIIR